MNEIVLVCLSLRITCLTDFLSLSGWKGYSGKYLKVIVTQKKEMVERKFKEYTFFSLRMRRERGRGKCKFDLPLWGCGRENILIAAVVVMVVVVVGLGEFRFDHRLKDFSS